MRKILTIVALLLSSVCFGQGKYDRITTNIKQQRMAFDSVVIVPRDTLPTNNPSYLGTPVGDSGRIAFKDGSLWYHRGPAGWARVGEQVDSTRFIQNQNAYDQPGAGFRLAGNGQAAVLRGNTRLEIGSNWRLNGNGSAFGVEYSGTSITPFFISTSGASFFDGSVSIENGTFAIDFGGTIAPRYMEFINFNNANQLGNTLMDLLQYDDVSKRVKRIPFGTAFAGVEFTANKATDLTSPDNTKYPTTLAISNAIAAIPVPNLQSVMGAGNTTTLDLVRNNGSVSNVFSASASAGVIGTTTNHSLGLYTNNLESFRLHRSGASGSVLIPTRAGVFLPDDGISVLQAKGTTILARAATTGGVYSHMRLSDENNSPRWEFGTLSVDGSSNTGFDFMIRGFDNSGALIPTVPFFMRRDDGSIGLGTIAQAGVRLSVNGATSLSGNTQVNGTLSLPITLLSGSLSVGNDPHYTIINRNTSGASNTLTLPAANSCTGRMYRIVDEKSNSVNRLTFSPSIQFKGASYTNIESIPFALANPSGDNVMYGSTVLLQSDGTNWIVVGL